ncbi:MAG TPA: nicotinamide-nucleotide amidohydrolase family protein, partial [bacterium]|nr:nicotinamide-nucleotide amidohydrolase family protein [bacterium]
MIKNNIGLICVGNELFSNVVNTNVHIATRICGLNGFEINFNIIVPDDIDKIISAVDFSLKHNAVIILSGGIGPTFDDITKEAISGYIGKKLIFSDKTWEKIQQGFRERKITDIPESNKKQAMIIQGATIIPNNIGTAAGMLVQHKNKFIFLLPGPPWEFEEMLKNSVIPLLKEKIYSANTFIKKSFNIAGESETSVEKKIEDIRAKTENVEAVWTILAKPYLVELLLTLPSSQEKAFGYVEKSLAEIFQDSYIENCSVPEALFYTLKEKKITCCFAESCTGGLAGHLMTEIPGVSQVFNGSIVAYSNKLKKKILRVPKTTLKKYGAVSEQTAAQMAKGARKYGKA